MERQNVTLSLPKSLLKKARAIAIREDKSLSALLRESLEYKVREAIGYKRARQKQMKVLKAGIDLGTQGHIAVSRDDIHARR
ncbi:MAG: CopG family transcriptional regulator [Thermodesulfobacteriota bacterium]